MSTTEAPPKPVTVPFVKLTTAEAERVIKRVRSHARELCNNPKGPAAQVDDAVRTLTDMQGHQLAQRAIAVADRLRQSTNSRDQAEAETDWLGTVCACNCPPHPLLRKLVYSAAISHWEELTKKKYIPVNLKG